MVQTHPNKKTKLFCLWLFPFCIFTVFSIGYLHELCSFKLTISSLLWIERDWAAVYTNLRRRNTYLENILFIYLFYTHVFLLLKLYDNNFVITFDTIYITIIIFNRSFTSDLLIDICILHGIPVIATQSHVVNSKNIFFRKTSVSFWHQMHKKWNCQEKILYSNESHHKANRNLVSRYLYLEIRIEF